MSIDRRVYTQVNAWESYRAGFVLSRDAPRQ